MNHKSELTTIEDIAQENGQAFWWAHEISNHLGYASFDSFKNVIRRAMSDADSIGVDSLNEFEPIKHNGISTYKLSRFAVMLCVTQADSKKENVKRAKTYLVGISEALFREVERLNEREKLKGNEKLMVDTAVLHGLSRDKIAIFKDRGYLGLYNMGIKQLKNHKGTPDFKGTLYDMMNPLELSANSFRAAMTADNIKNNNITNEQEIISTAQSVGKAVRDVIVKNTGQNPEDIPLEAEKINKIKTRVKKQSRKINQLPNLTETSND